MTAPSPATSTGPATTTGSATSTGPATTITGPGARTGPIAGGLDGSPLPAELAARLKRDTDHLVCAVVQQFDTRDVLMVGWMDDEALSRTLTSGRVTFWSRSRQEYWRKGDTSGHAQWVKSVSLDCDGDALLITVDQVGAACHTGENSCFDADQLVVTVGERP